MKRYITTIRLRKITKYIDGYGLYNSLIKCNTLICIETFNKLKSIRYDKMIYYICHAMYIDYIFQCQIRVYLKKSIILNKIRCKYKFNLKYYRNMLKIDQI